MGALLCFEIDSHSIIEPDEVEHGGYVRGLDVASQKTMAMYRGEGGEAPPDRKHDGIEDARDKGSTVWYCAHDRWVPLPGMD
jgi:hypothetical protein